MGAVARGQASGSREDLERRVRALLAAGQRLEAAVAVVLGLGPEVYAYLRRVDWNKERAEGAYSRLLKRLLRCGVPTFGWDRSLRTRVYAMAWKELTAPVMDLVPRLHTSLRNQHVYYDGDLRDWLRSLLKGSWGTSVHARATLRRGFSRVVVVHAAGRRGASSRRIRVRPLPAGDRARPLGRAVAPHRGRDPPAGADSAPQGRAARSVLLPHVSVPRILSRKDLQRLRGLGFTQGDHRVLYCGKNPVLDERSMRTAYVRDRDPEVWRVVNDESAWTQDPADGGEGAPSGGPLPGVPITAHRHTSLQ